MTNDEIKEQGKQAFLAGESFSSNPYLHFSPKRGGLVLSGHWQTGYMQAEKEASAKLCKQFAGD
jgi:hypothetical protein